MELNLNAESSEARRANELARELLTSRALVGHGSDLALFNETLGRVIDETFEGFILSEALAERIAYLVGALSAVGAAGVWTAGKAFEAVELGDAEKTSIESIHEEDIRLVLKIISRYMASHPSGL